MKHGDDIFEELLDKSHHIIKFILADVPTSLCLHICQTITPLICSTLL